MLIENAVLGGEGNGGVIDPRVGYVRDSFVAMALVLDLLAATGEPLSQLVADLPRYAMVKDQYPLATGKTAGQPGHRRGHRTLGPDRGGVPGGDAPIVETAFASTGMIAGCTFERATPSQSSG